MYFLLLHITIPINPLLLAGNRRGSHAKLLCCCLFAITCLTLLGCNPLRKAYPSQKATRRVTNNNTRIGGTGKAILSNVHKVRGWPATATWSAKTCPDLHLMPTSYDINFFMSWRHPSIISCSIPRFQTIKQPKNTALNHPEARKFEAFSRLEDMSNVKTIRMDWYTLIQMTKNAYHMSTGCLQVYTLQVQIRKMRFNMLLWSKVA